MAAGERRSRRKGRGERVRWQTRQAHRGIARDRRKLVHTAWCSRITKCYVEMKKIMIFTFMASCGELSIVYWDVEK